jgi:hypothetical protein
MAEPILIPTINKLFAHLGTLADSLGGAQSQTKGLLVLRDRALIIAALGDLSISLVRIESEAAGAASEVDEVLRQLEQSRTDAA